MTTITRIALIPTVVAAALAAAAGVCGLIGLPWHGRDLLTAAVIAVVASEIAVMPILIFRRSAPTLMAQAALGGTVVHLLLTVLLAIALMIVRFVEPGGAFVYWLTGAYWLSLGMLVWALIGIIHQTSAEAK